MSDPPTSRPSSSGVAILMDTTAFPVDLGRALRRALNRAYGERRDPAISSLASRVSVCLADATATTPERRLVYYLAEILRVAVDARSLHLGAEVDDAAEAIQRALVGDGVVRDPGRSMTPYTADRRGK
jgi:hypothetical protein